MPEFIIRSSEGSTGPGEATWVEAPGGQRYVAAHRETAEHRPPHLERIEHSERVAGEGLHRRRCRLERAVEAGQRRRNHPPAREGRELRAPHPNAQRERVQEHQRAGPARLAGFGVVGGPPVDGDRRQIERHETSSYDAGAER